MPSHLEASKSNSVPAHFICAGLKSWLRLTERKTFRHWKRRHKLSSDESMFDISFAFVALHSLRFILWRRREARLIWQVEGDLTTPKSIRIHLSIFWGNEYANEDGCILSVMHSSLESLSSNILGWINSSNNFLSSFFESFLHFDHCNCIGTPNQRAQTKPHLAD